MRGKTSQQSWRRVVLGAIRTNHIAASMLNVTTPCCSGRLPKKNSGGTFYATIQGAPFMQLQLRGSSHAKNKIKSTNNIRTYTRNHSSQNESTDRRHARNDFLLITTHPTHNSPPKHKTKNTDRSINSHLSDSLMSSCEVAVEGLSYQSHFFHDIPKLSQIQSIN